MPAPAPSRPDQKNGPQEQQDRPAMPAGRTPSPSVQQLKDRLARSPVSDRSDIYFSPYAFRR